MNRTPISRAPSLARDLGLLNRKVPRFHRSPRRPRSSTFSFSSPPLTSLGQEWVALQAVVNLAVCLLRCQSC